jgi:hypothetical protein
VLAFTNFTRLDVSDLIFLALFKNVAIETWMGNTHFDQISALF